MQPNISPGGGENTDKEVGRVLLEAIDKLVGPRASEAERDKAMATIVRTAARNVAPNAAVPVLNEAIKIRALEVLSEAA